MMPTLNMMAVMGLVSIPGVMTGQILAGQDPSDVGGGGMVSGGGGMVGCGAERLAGGWCVLHAGPHPHFILAPSQQFPQRLQPFGQGSPLPHGARPLHTCPPL